MSFRERIKRFVRIHGTLVKWGLFLVSIVLMLMAIQIYMNYITIIENTETIKLQNAKVQEEIDYINNYQMKYLDSTHASFFLSHENNILKDGETVIAFKGPEKSVKAQESSIQKKETPWEARKQYFNEKIEKVY